MKAEEFPLFSMLNQTQLKNLLSACEQVTIPVGTVFIEQGNRGENLFFLLSGEGQVFVVDSDDEEQEIVVISAPAVIGEMEALTGEPRAASVRSRTEIEALALSFDELHARLLDGDPATLKVFFQIARVVARRLAAMNRKFAEIERAPADVHLDDLHAFQQKLVNEWTV